MAADCVFLEKMPEHMFLSKNNKFYFLGGLLLVAILIWVAVFTKAESSFLEVTFFDIGQGDAIFIETPGGSQILIDGGPDDTVIEKLGKVMPFWDRTIDMIILTHPEADHITGLLEVLRRYEVENILWTGVLHDSANYQEWLKLIEEEQAQIFLVKAGQRIKFGENMMIDVLYPVQDYSDKESKKLNNTSVVNRLLYGQNSFLLTGDIEKSVEYELVGRKIYLDSDILKIGHHGSKTSTSEEFLKAVTPEAVVISVGRDNHFGHPTEEVLDALEKYNINILRTDLDGDILIMSDGRHYEIRE